ncbi:thiopeptide-type bacteriocin biosynthesis protein [Gemmatimonas aurantiaca]|uniref:thiopeptide-type bacteriocin biosynthesis protein n=1 Tax=Gemmatimonas aurantiaca TaxID=173480 RepID=UPI00301BF343
MTHSDEQEDVWVGAHIYLEPNAGRQAYDDVLRRAIAPTARACIRRGDASRFFFIRYGENGPHLRLRLRIGRRNFASTKALLEDELAAQLTATRLGAPVPALPEPAQPSSLSGVWWVPYVPETARYGGSGALPLCEVLFATSSELACRVVETFSLDALESRYGIALSAMVALLAISGVGRNGASRIAQLHRNHWLGARLRVGQVTSATTEVVDQLAVGDGHSEMIERVWAAASFEVDQLPEPLCDFVENTLPLMAALRNLCASGGVVIKDAPANDWEEACSALLPSLLHMSNNRFGILPSEESVLAEMIVRALW